MLIEMKSPAFKEMGKERPPITFKKGLNVILGEEDGAMSIGKSSALLAIDFVFGGDTYIRSDGVKKVSELESKLKRETLRADFYEEMVAFGKEVYGIDLKKAGTK